ncbi:histone acetyl transferase HAT1 [Phlyctema vagabunda]|uniref:Histone acetyltransferase type B catalytic subunit n=1 Tax=Phlyctema vagabunda TaxID=108571 RepID=A0ABR4P7K0_9HELO
MAEHEADDWSTDSNDAIHISLVAPSSGGIKQLHTFHPKMTYSIFGEEESIFGYQGLKVNLKYNASDMRPSLQVTYNKKFKTIGETEPTDVKAVLEEYLPKTSFEKSSVFESAVSNTPRDWKPPGELYKTIKHGEQTFEIWKGSLADLSIQQLVKRIQILIPLFIEGGTLLDLKDPDGSLDRWTVFCLYKKTAEAAAEGSPYVFIGYSTIYRYFYYQSVTPPTTPPKGAKRQRINYPATLDFKLPVKDISFSDVPCRSRISQFFILPPFQGGGNGARFYNAIFDFYLAEPQTIEITVEDPNEAFDDLRDLNDLTRLRGSPEFTSLRINTGLVPKAKGPAPKNIVDGEKLEKIRKDFKIPSRQFSRVVEMQLLSLIPKSIRQSLIVEETKLDKAADPKAKKHEYHLWKILTKERLYRHNKDALAQLDRSDRIEKLDQTIGSVEADYARLLRALDNKRGAAGSKDQGEGVEKKTSGTKRSSPDDEDDEDEPEAPAAKRART